MTTFHDQTPLLPPLDKGEITCTRTPRGVMAHIPVMKLSGSSGRELYLADLGWSINDARFLLPLLPLNDDYQDPSSGPRSFTPCASYADGVRGRRCLRRLSTYQAVAGKLSGPWTWMDIHLLHCDRGHPEDTSLPTIPINYSHHSPFRFPDINIRPFMSNIEEMFSPDTRASLAVSRADIPWPGSPPATFTFGCRRVDPALVIQVGICSAHLSDVPGSSTGCHALGQPDPRLWARAIYYESPDEDTDEHSCSTDHVDDWPDKQRCFKDGRLYAKEIHTVLSFISHPSRDNLTPRQPCQLKAWMGFGQDCHLCLIDHESGCACSQAISVQHDN